MKIALNKCYGGFGLSDAVHEKLIELGVPHYKTWNDIPKKKTEPYVVDSGKDDKLFGKYYSNFRDDDKRNHPLLIQAIENIGINKASSSLAEIRIVEIPDGIDYEIDDYDGVETIHETHRSW